MAALRRIEANQGQRGSNQEHEEEGAGQKLDSWPGVGAAVPQHPTVIMAKTISSMPGSASSRLMMMRVLSDMRIPFTSGIKPLTDTQTVIIGAASTRIAQSREEDTRQTRTPCRISPAFYQ